MIRWITVQIFILIYGLPLCAMALSYHVVMGPVFPILENDLIQVLHSKAGDNNVQAQIKAKITNKLESQLSSLPDASHLKTSHHLSHYRYIPTVNVKDPKNSHVSQIPLLSKISYFPSVLVFNPDSQAQLAWATAALKLHSNATVIATGGNLVVATKRLKHAVTYDDSGIWAKRFKLTALPALIVHKGGLSLEITQGVADDA